MEAIQAWQLSVVSQRGNLTSQDLAAFPLSAPARGRPLVIGVANAPSGIDQPHRPV